jgi:hypothetical protein
MMHPMTWRDVIHEYLKACREDSQATRAKKKTSLEHFASDALLQLMKENERQSAEWVASQTVPSPDTYKEIEATPTRVVAEVEKAKSFELSFATRFLLTSVVGEWKIEDIFWKCTCTDGACFFCRARGKCIGCGGNGFISRFFGLRKVRCRLCNGKKDCNTCNGTGRCTFCCDSDIPGWNSKYRLRRE